MNPTSQTERIAAELRDAILKGRYQSGDRLPSERELAARFGVQRGPVREALKKLEQLGLAEIKPGGARCNALEQASLDVIPHLLALSDPPDPQIVDQVLEVAAWMIRLAAELAAQRADESQRQQMLALLKKLSAREIAAETEHTLMSDLSDLLVLCSRNVVLSLFHQGIKTHFFDNLESRQSFISLPDRPRIREIKRMAAGFEARDAEQTVLATINLGLLIRKAAAEDAKKKLDVEAKSNPDDVAYGS